MMARSVKLLRILIRAFLSWCFPKFAPSRTRFVVANGVKLQYVDWGGQGDSLLLLPGLGNDAHVFDSFARRFTDRFRVLALTRRGFGRSDKPKNGYDVSTRGEDIRRFLDELSICQVNLMGHSIAGDEMTTFAARYPDRVIKLVYLDAAIDRYHFTAEMTSDPAATRFDKRLYQEIKDDPRAALTADILPTFLGLVLAIAFVALLGPSINHVILALAIIIGWTVRNLRRRKIRRAIVGCMKSADEFRPNYQPINAQALAIYAMSAVHPRANYELNGAKRKVMNSWFTASTIARKQWSMEQFKREMRCGEVVEMPNANHFLFLGRTGSEVVTITRAFLLK
jgi:pimeloyl-ACP methyl ester carboxylesterase